MRDWFLVPFDVVRLRGWRRVYPVDLGNENRPSRHE